MLGQSGAIARRPPHANGALDDGLPDPLAVCAALAFGAASTAATLTLPNGIPIGGCWLSVSVDSDCYLHFGPNSSIAAASAATSWPQSANTTEQYWINEKDLYFRVIRKTADGVLNRYRSNL